MLPGSDLVLREVSPDRDLKLFGVR